MTYATTVHDITQRDAAIARSTRLGRRQRALVRRSDALLSRLEGLNLAKYGAIRYPAESDLHAVRLTHDLVAAINELRLGVGLMARRLRTTAEALDAVWQAQAVLFGTEEDESA